VDSPRYVEGRDAPARFTELVKSPEHIHTIGSRRIRKLERASAVSAGTNANQITAQKRKQSRNNVTTRASSGPISKTKPTSLIAVSRMLTRTSLFPRFSSDAHHHGSLPQPLGGGLKAAAWAFCELPVVAVERRRWMRGAVYLFQHADSSCSPCSTPKPKKRRNSPV
jgi:hypothetical protein